MKKLLRGPIFWIAMAVLFVLIGSSFISGIGAPEQVEMLHAWAQHGQAGAEVFAVEQRAATSEEEDDALGRGFEQRPSA